MAKRQSDTEADSGGSQIQEREAVTYRSGETIRYRSGQAVRYRSGKRWQSDTGAESSGNQI